MDEEKITQEEQMESTDNESPVTVQMFEEDQINEEDYYVSNSSRKRQFMMAQIEKESEKIDEQKKRSVFKNVANFIYHHKLISIVVGVVLATVVVSGVVRLCQRPCDYNIAIYTDGEKFTDTELDSVAELFRTCGEDRTGDGKITVSVRAYRPLGGNDVSNFIQEQALRRDIYGTSKYGNRVNHIIVTDESVRDMIYDYFGTIVFDEICEDGVWAEADRKELLGTDNGGKSLGFMVFAYNYYDSDPDKAKKNNKDAHEVFEAINKKHPELFSIQKAE